MEYILKIMQPQMEGVWALKHLEKCCMTAYTALKFYMSEK